MIADQRSEAREVLLKKASELDSPVIETASAYETELQEMLRGRVRETAREISSGERFTIAPQLAGRFQLQNALNAVAASRVLQSQGTAIDKLNIERGIASAEWPGRIEKVHSSPDIYLDGAHNPSAARELALFLEENVRGKKIVIVFGALRDKAVDEIAGILFPLAAKVILTEPATPRSISALQLSEIAGHHAAHFEVIPNAETALGAALAQVSPSDVIVITGSLYWSGQLRHHWQSATRAGAR